MRFVAGSLAVVAVVLAVVVAARGSGAPACGGVERGLLPEWARTGFSEPEPRAPHVVGDRERLAAIVFGDPLSAPPRPGVANKILWVARRTPPPGPLELTAKAGGRTLRRTVESGPGPSIVDLPAGCWQVEARWPGGRDTLELSYARR